jgi:apolipoprotein N-acyltransferase
LGLAKLTAGASDFSAGDGLRTLSLPGLPPASPLICYEVIFPGRVVAPGPRPEWILNVTNDAWFGLSSGPYQHFATARLRAVAEGLPLVRAANSGISAVIDAYGRVMARLGLDRVGVIDAPLPKPVQEKTLFGRFGNWTLLILLVVTISLQHASRRIS